MPAAPDISSRWHPFLRTSTHRHLHCSASSVGADCLADARIMHTHLTPAPRTGVPMGDCFRSKTDYLISRQVVLECHASQDVVTAITSVSREIDRRQV